MNKLNKTSSKQEIQQEINLMNADSQKSSKQYLI